ncbi:MAG TPA: chorismate mutase [Alphaproteobacteria bacterium]
MSNDRSIDELRQEIDRIDDQIHDLLMRRTEIVGRIGAVKRQNEPAVVAMRPGREAQIIRRLVARHSGPFPVEVLVRIWRELLSAQVSVQGDFSIGAFVPEGVAVYRDLARDQFGSSTPLKTFQAVSQVVHEVWSGNVSIGILPFPVGERADPWWRTLAVSGGAAPKIIARLPFVISKRANSNERTALAIAMVEPEPTDDDVSLLAIERLSDISRDRLRAEMKAGNLVAEWLAVWQDPDSPGHALHLVSVEGFLAAADARLTDFRLRAGESVGRLVVLGSYPRPINAAA